MRQVLDGMQADVDQRQAAVTAVRRFFLGEGSDAPEKIGGGRASTISRVAPGSVADRVLEILRERGPSRMVDLVAQAKAREGDVKKAVASLMAAKRVVRTGQRRSTRYTVK